eukprot:10543013-Lingulodinium_polyedra.AAC.1
MRSCRRFAVATARTSHARTLHAGTENWPAHGTRERAICEPLRRRNVVLTTSSRNVRNSVQRCCRIDGSPSQRLANRTA